MSDFARGLILGGGNIFGESSGGAGGGVDFEARNVNRELKAQNRELKAQLAGKNAVFDALLHSLHEVDPGHPMVAPYEPGTNPLRQKIADRAYHEALNNPEL